MDPIDYDALIAGDSYHGPNRPVKISHLVVRNEEPIPDLVTVEIHGWAYWGYKLFGPKVVRVRNIRKYVTLDMITKLRLYGKIYLIGDIYTYETPQ